MVNQPNESTIGDFAKEVTDRLIREDEDLKRKKKQLKMELKGIEYKLRIRRTVMSYVRLLDHLRKNTPQILLLPYELHNDKTDFFNACHCHYKAYNCDIFNCNQEHEIKDIYSPLFIELLKYKEKYQSMMVMVDLHLGGKVRGYKGSETYLDEIINIKLSDKFLKGGDFELSGQDGSSSARSKCDMEFFGIECVYFENVEKLDFGRHYCIGNFKREMTALILKNSED